MNVPKISVLMGIYNNEKTLSEAVDCIINQTYTNWELILCDDGSKDRTYEVAQMLCTKDYRIKLIKNKQNMGLAATLNHCLKYAQGEYIARMDGDDLCVLNRFQKEIDFLNSHKEYALVSSGMNFFDEDGIYGNLIYMEKPQVKDFVRGSQFCHASCMIKKDALLQLGGYDISKKSERIEDYDLWIRLYRTGYKGYNIPEVLYSMRDDRNAYHRRKMKYRVNESRLILNLCNYYKLSAKYKCHSVKPIILGITPEYIYKVLHRKKLKIGGE
jgi:glycosyltransferase EpsE